MNFVDVSRRRRRTSSGGGVTSARSRRATAAGSTGRADLVAGFRPEHLELGDVAERGDDPREGRRRRVPRQRGAAPRHVAGTRATSSPSRLGPPGQAGRRARPQAAARAAPPLRRAERRRDRVLAVAALAPSRARLGAGRASVRAARERSRGERRRGDRVVEGHSIGVDLAGQSSELEECRELRLRRTRGRRPRRGPARPARRRAGAASRRPASRAGSCRRSTAARRSRGGRPRTGRPRSGTTMTMSCRCGRGRGSAARRARSPTSIVARLARTIRSGGSMTTSASSAARSGISSESQRGCARRFEESLAALLVAPDRRRPEHVVAERVIRVPVGVDNDADRVGGQLAQVVEDLAPLIVAAPGVDDERLVMAEYDADLLVENAYRRVKTRSPISIQGRAIRADRTAPSLRRRSGAVRSQRELDDSGRRARDGTRCCVRRLARRWGAVGHAPARPRARGALRALRARRRAHFAAAGSTPRRSTFAASARPAGDGRGRAVVELHDDIEERVRRLRAAPERRSCSTVTRSAAWSALGTSSTGAQPDLLVLSAPAIGADIPAWQRALVTVLGAWRPGRASESAWTAASCRPIPRSGSTTSRIP